jgi:hypothetical protein
VLTADADAQALLQSVLGRHRALGIRPITYHVHRFPGRDSGMIKQGPEIARVLVDKTQYSRLLLVWDHHGSGWESRSPEESMALIQERLDGITWLRRASAVVLLPELEEWLWHCKRSIAMRLKMTELELSASMKLASDRLGRSPEQSMRELPKELFGTVFYGKMKKQPLPEDFKALGASARIADLRRSASFESFNRILHGWFSIPD